VARRLVIVESPAKARTLARHLGTGYVVRASMGHVRDLPKGRLGVDVTRGFAPEYEVLPARRRLLAGLRDAVVEADEVYLAADPDREGEGICWHLQEELAGRGRVSPRFLRVELHEITAHAIEAAFGAPRAVDRRRVDAQQTRRLLDRLVGYTVSPLLWRRLRPGLSAGRVQSVALRLVCDREREVEAFSPAEYWVVRAHLSAARPPVFVASLVEKGGKRAEIHTAAEAAAVRALLERAALRVLDVTQKERRRTPPPPFVTSTLQQEAFRKLRFPVKKTMKVAQQLYEGVDLGEEGPIGLISYMRTDSPRVAKEAATAVREHIGRTFGDAFVPEAPPSHRSRPSAQGAHEAIRPTDVERTKQVLASHLGKDELALYALIWSRFVASQMAPAVYDETVVEIEARVAEGGAPGEPCRLRAKGSSLRFSGFLAAYEEPPEERTDPGDADPAGRLPPLEGGEALSLVKLDTDQRFTEPPPRFNEATLVRELERNGVGRPSTYASILATLDSRDYVERRESRLRPTRLGFLVTDLLVAGFPDLLSVSYTARMEESLDAIEEGRDNLLNTLTVFWKKLEKELASARRADSTGGPPRLVETGRTTQDGEPVEGTCPECGAGLVRKSGRHGPFVGCRRYPACRYVQKKAAKPVGLACPGCHEGEVVERPGPGNRTFYGCSRYPACRFTSHHRPVAESCPECGRLYLLERTTRKDGRIVFCGNEACTHHRTG
jgi:DNA topoisomerase I